MHTTSAAQMKGTKRGVKFNNGKPREGSRMRELYDLFYNNKGKIVDFCATDTNGASRLSYLTDIYGLDIRRIRKNKWCLVGEWFGKVYVDYTQEQT
jgi:hypothetical protein